jgi:hypothetical protein
MAGAINYNPQRLSEALKTKAFAAPPTGLECGCSSGVEHNLAKVRVEGSNPFARSNFLVIAKSKRPLLEGPLSHRFNAKASALAYQGQDG